MPALGGCMRDKRLCCNVMCCGPCMIGRQCAALEGQQKTMSMMHCVGAIMGGFTICVCCIRTKASEKYGLGENMCYSCIVANNCPCCSLIQTHKVLRRHGARPGMVLTPPKLSGMSDEMKGKHRADKQERRNKRRQRNHDRRGRRGKGHDSSSESDSSSDSN